MSGARLDPASAHDRLTMPMRFLRSWLLLLVEEREGHGYDLVTRLGAVGIIIDPGHLYRTLRDMEQAGLVWSRWTASASGPARRTYRLTDEGFDSLGQWAGEVAECHLQLAAFVECHDRLSRRALESRLSSGGRGSFDEAAGVGAS